MTVREAILTLNTNVVIACERSGFSSATVKMIEDALDTIEDALKAQEPRVLTLDEVMALEERDSFIRNHIAEGAHYSTFKLKRPMTKGVYHGCKDED